MDEAQLQTDSQQKPYDIKDLEKMYTQADEADKDLFAEQRSNILLITGEHYNRLRSNFFRRLRDSRSISTEQKIRLTKNHIQKIADSYVNHVVSSAPGVGFEPEHDSDLADQKTAELNESVWQYAKEKHALEEVIQGWAEDFVGIGEVATKVFYDETEQDILFEEVFGFNLLIDPAATSFLKARYAIIRKMVDVKDLQKMFPGDDHKKFIQESSDTTYTIFDRGKGAYTRSKDQCLVREYYFRPCALYPNGYFFYTVKDHVLAEGELPGGLFPIVMKPFKRLPTKSRGQSIVKTLRPFQAEVNRSASKIAEHQITLGDDKLLIQNGTQVSAGAALPGIRSVNYTGMEPKILAGRDGSQYLNYMTSQITEMYQAANLEEQAEDANIPLDPYALLFRSASQKKKFQLYIKRFEYFLIDVCKLYLDLARYHFPDEMVIKMVGRKEQVNLAEFKNSDPLCVRIKVIPQSDDVETKLGKQMVINHMIQYVGNKLEKEDIGKLMRLSPYANFDESFNDLTLDYDSATNDILALDRGEQPPVSPNDPHPYFIKRLNNRMRQPDFQFLAPQIQQSYAQRVDAHENFMAQQAQQIQMAEAGFIPTAGYLVACDFYVQTDQADPSKTRRVRLPSDALQWLIQKLETQGQSLDQLEGVNQENLAQIAQKTGNHSGSAMPVGPNNGKTMPQGERNGRSSIGVADNRNASPGYNPGARHPGI